jgi:hypothetical protein
MKGKSEWCLRRLKNNDVKGKNLFIQELMFKKVQKIEHLIFDRIFLQTVFNTTTFETSRRNG